jgi:hypothetical protein
VTAPNRFEDRLLRELRQVVAERPAPAIVVRRRPRRARIVLAGAGRGGHDRRRRACREQRRGDAQGLRGQGTPHGTVTVSIHRLSDADGLERRLRAAGVPAVVDYAPGANRLCDARGANEAPGAGGAAGPTTPWKAKARPTPGRASRNQGGRLRGARAGRQPRSASAAGATESSSRSTPARSSRTRRCSLRPRREP